MSNTPADWPRPNFQQGGDVPFLFYVVYGPVPSEFTISQSHFRCAGIPNGIEITAYGPSTKPEVLDTFRSGYLWDELLKSNNTLADDITNQNECLVIKGDVKDHDDLNYFRDVIGLIQWLLDSGGVAVYDPQSFRWWSADIWRNNAFESDSGSPRNHVTILTSEEEQGEWIHTRGLRKFGRPDLSIHHVLPEFREPVLELINRFIELQAFGGVIPDNEEIRIVNLPDGMTCHHRGDVDNPDFNNVHIEIEWPKVC